jgi:hypothetical protein
MSKAHRSEAISLAGFAEDTLRDSLGKRDRGALDRFERALDAKFDHVRTFSLYPQIAKMIASEQFTATRTRQVFDPPSRRAIPETLARNPIAEVLARSPCPHEIA